MSRARPTAQRAPLDAYGTPPYLARAICERLQHLHPDSVVEPSAGHGPFVAAARAVWPTAHVTAVDLNPSLRPELLAAGADVALVGDWRTLARQLESMQPPDGIETRLVVGNPPYRQAEEHVRVTMDWLRPGDCLAFLLRINVLGSVRRLELWRDAPLAWMAPIVPRPSFTNGGTDGTEYALFVWEKDHRGSTRIAPAVTWINPRGGRRERE